MPRPLGELLDEYEAERLAEIARYEARREAPAERARLQAKRRAEAEATIKNRRRAMRCDKFCPVSMWGA